MNDTSPPLPPAPAAVVGHDLLLSLTELSQASGAPTDLLVVLIHEGVISPQGDAPERWAFDNLALRRARIGMRLLNDLHVNEAGLALALDLIDEIERLQRLLARPG